jgi:ankyrin repeat protein
VQIDLFEKERLVSPTDEPGVAAAVVAAIRGGDLTALQRLIDERPDLVTARVNGRTALHVVTDWPGYYPNGPAIVRMLIAAGADPNADTGGEAPETPLHWAASTDDLDVADALIDAGADLETPGGSIGTPLDNAIGYGCWHVAHRLVERGARVDKLWHAAALGLMSRVEELIMADPRPRPDDINDAFWQACHGGQRRTADYLLHRGADINTTVENAHGTALDVATGPDTRRDLLGTWLREQGAQPG